MNGRENGGDVMDINDAELLNLIKDDAEAGIAKLIDVYSGYVYAIVRNRLYGVCTPEDIEEAVSDVFADVYRRRFEIDLSVSPLKAFVSTLAKRTAIDRYRRATSSPVLVSQDDEENGLSDISSGEDIEENAVEREEREALIAAVKSLGEPDSTIVLRKFWLGETSYEISRAVSLSQNAVTKRLARALKKLKTALSGKSVSVPEARKDMKV